MTGGWMHDDRGARVGGSGHSRHRYGRKSCTATRRRSVFVFNDIEGPARGGGGGGGFIHGASLKPDDSEDRSQQAIGSRTPGQVPASASPPFAAALFQAQTSATIFRL